MPHRHLVPALALLGLAGAVSACTQTPAHPAASAAVTGASAPGQSIPGQSAPGQSAATAAQATPGQAAGAQEVPSRTTAASAAHRARTASAHAVTGIASYYRRGPGLHRTCTGQPFVNHALTAASPSLPMGTVAQVRRLDSGRAVTVVINDCMPRGRRVIDLSVEAARKLGLMASGLARVTVTPLTTLAENDAPGA